MNVYEVFAHSLARRTHCVSISCCSGGDGGGADGMDGDVNDNGIHTNGIDNDGEEEEEGRQMRRRMRVLMMVKTVIWPMRVRMVVPWLCW